LVKYCERENFFFFAVTNANSDCIPDRNLTTESHPKPNTDSDPKSYAHCNPDPNANAKPATDCECGP
jgi:hypothetical protein